MGDLLLFYLLKSVCSTARGTPTVFLRKKPRIPSGRSRLLSPPLVPRPRLPRTYMSAHSCWTKALLEAGGPGRVTQRGARTFTELTGSSPRVLPQGSECTYRGGGRVRGAGGKRGCTSGCRQGPPTRSRHLGWGWGSVRQAERYFPGKGQPWARTPRRRRAGVHRACHPFLPGQCVK